MIHFTFCHMQDSESIVMVQNPFINSHVKNPVTKLIFMKQIFSVHDSRD